jgi:hypothetical protein
MNDEIPQAQMSGDVGTQSIGKNAYIAARNGDFGGKGLKHSSIVALIVISLVFFVSKFTLKRNVKETSGKPFLEPGLSRDDHPIDARLLTTKDLTNVIERPKTQASYFGKIRVVSLRSISEIPIGSEMKAVLASGATDGIVKARLTKPLIVDGEPIVPENAVLFGKGKSGEERLFVEFSKVIFPGGESFPIRAQAFDVSDKILGLKGAFVGSRTKKMAGAMAFGFLGGMADGLQNTNGSYFMMNKPTARDAALAGASKAALDQSQVYLNELKNAPNIIEVKVGTEIVVLTDEPKQKDER